jgi:translation initiation factor 3 subunit L
MRGDESDSDDEVLASTLVEAMHEDDDLYDDAASGGFQVTGDDIQARITAAVTPLEFTAPLPVRIASYDNFCTLFHFILNSDGPVDLDLPTVSALELVALRKRD